MIPRDVKAPTISIQFRKSAAGQLFLKDFGENVCRNGLCVEQVPLEGINGRIFATVALIHPPGIGVVVPGEPWDDKARPMLDHFLAFEESFNRFSGFNYEVQWSQERVDGHIKFYTYVVRE
jgi:arginine/lysine/ornithine decarboxylase